MSSPERSSFDRGKWLVTGYGCSVSSRSWFASRSRINLALPDNRTKRPVMKSAERSAMEKLLSDLQGHALAWPFLQPVNADDVADYYEYITHPMGKLTLSLV